MVIKGNQLQNGFCKTTKIVYGLLLWALGYLLSENVILSGINRQLSKVHPDVVWFVHRGPFRRVRLQTKHRFSIALSVSWCCLWLNIREVGALSVTLKPATGLTTLIWPSTVMIKELTQKEETRSKIGRWH